MFSDDGHMGGGYEGGGSSGLLGLTDADRLYELARSKDPKARIELGDAIGHLCSARHLNVREQEIVSDILITMLRQAEKDLRRAIAERVSNLDRAPLRVILHLSNDDIDVAQNVLERSRVLEDMDLMLIIETRDSPYWQAIAKRKGLQAPVVRALVDQRDEATASVLVRNDDAEIPHDSYSVLAEMASASNDISGPLLQRTDFPKDLVAVVYARASEAIQHDLRERMGYIPEDVSENIDDVTSEFVSAAQHEFVPTSMMLDAARSIHARGLLRIDTMIQSLASGQIASFMAQMMVYLNIDLKTIRMVMAEPTGETLAAFSRVNNLEKKVFLKIFLLTQRYRSGEKMVDPLLLNQALLGFDQMTLKRCNERMQEICGMSQGPETRH